MSLAWMSKIRRNLSTLLVPHMQPPEEHWAYKLGLARGRKTGRSTPNTSDLVHLHSREESDRKMYAAGMLAASASPRRSRGRNQKNR